MDWVLDFHNGMEADVDEHMAKLIFFDVKRHMVHGYKSGQIGRNIVY